MSATLSAVSHHDSRRPAPAAAGRASVPGAPSPGAGRRARPRRARRAAAPVVRTAAARVRAGRGGRGGPGGPGGRPAGGRVDAARDRAGAGSPWSAACAGARAGAARRHRRLVSTPTQPRQRPEPAPTRSPQITGGRPAKTVDGALNILLRRQRLAGSGRTRSTSRASGGRTRSSSCTSRPTTSTAYLVSIPRDLYVHDPEEHRPTCDSGDTKAKINAAFAFGGAAAGRADRRVLHRRPHRPRDG